MPYMSYATKFQALSEPFLRTPKRYLPLLEFLSQVMDEESELSKAEREMVALYVSKLNDCGYCIGSHTSVLEALGVDSDTVAEAAAGRSDDPRMQAALTFARKLTQELHGVSQEDVDAVTATGLSEQAVEDLVNVVAVFAYLNRFANGIGMTGSPAGFAKSGPMIAERGYEPLAVMARSKVSAPVGV